MKVKYSTKYGNIKQQFDGHIFDSIRERKRYQELCLLSAAGEIKGLEVHPEYELQASFKDRHGKAVRSIKVTWDFRYCMTDDNQMVVEDVKSPATRKETAYNIRRRMFIKRYPEVDFREVV